MRNQSETRMVAVEHGRSADDRLVIVDALRGVAALAVAATHLPPMAGKLAFLDWVQDRGYLGVGLFLVLSGFSIHFRWASSAELGHFDYGRFWRRRARRLYPAYLGAYLLSVLIYVVWFGEPVSSSRWPWIGTPSAPLAVLGSLALPLANILPYTYVGVAWSIGLELQLYAVYAAVVRHLRRIGVARVVAISAVVTLVFRYVVLITTAHGHLSVHGTTPGLAHTLFVFAPSRLLEWMLGMAAAEAYFGRLRMPAISESGIAAVLALGIGLVIEQQPLSNHVLGVSVYDLLVDPVMGIGFVCLLRALIRHQSARAVAAIARPLAWIGFFSYSLYVTHIALQHAVLKLVFDHTSLPNTAWGIDLTLALAYVGAVLGAYVVHRIFERPFLVGHSPSQTPDPVASTGVGGPQATHPELTV